MGASNCPETPRQRMIGMMYLVLTALLALNVSKDILNAFAIVDETLTTSNEITLSKNNQDYQELERQKTVLGEDKVVDQLDKANKIAKLSNDMIAYIEQLRIQYIEYVDVTAYNSDSTYKTVSQLNHKDNISKSTFFMTTEGKAKELKMKLLEFRKQILTFVEEEDRARMSLTIGLDVEAVYKSADGAKESWETHYFENVIFAAGVTLLNKTVGEVRNAESSLLKYTLASIGKTDFKFSNITGRAIPKSQLVFQGEPYEADIIVAAYDDKRPFEAYYRMGSGTMTSAGGSMIRGENGIAKLKINTANVGDFTYSGLIKVIGADGKPETYPFSESFTVMRPSATVAADKMNVLYAGIENPVSANAAVSAEKVGISLVGGGSFTRTGPGKYDIKVTDDLIGKTITVNVLADVGGKQVAMGSNVYRIKRVPDPVAVLGGNFKGGKIGKAELLANPFVMANMGTDFAYDLTWAINSYQVTFLVKGIEDAPITGTNKMFSDAIKTKINSCGTGTVIYFSQIKATCVAGTRTLNDITVILK